MTISVWRYSHLALAVSSFIFILLASVTGIILSFEPVSDSLKPHALSNLDEITLAETVSNLRKNYSEAIEIKVEKGRFVSADIIDDQGESQKIYIDPKTGKSLGKVETQSEFFQFVTTLHRSLFLHGTGRLFMGITAFLLFLIAITGSILVLKRQRKISRFFSKVVRENNFQFLHVVFGRIWLVPILIITSTGVFLTMDAFEFFDKTAAESQIDYGNLTDNPKLDLAVFPVFQKTPLSDVISVEFPFSEDIEDAFSIELKDRKLAVNQYTGEVLSENLKPSVQNWLNLSLDLHTGRSNIAWALVLAIAAANILFFIYSGFAMTLKRRNGKIVNKFTPENAEFIILAGSENGSTMKFAKAFHEALLKSRNKSFFAELNSYQSFDSARHIIAITATYGIGEAPENAKKTLSLLEKHRQNHSIKFSVVGFGSHAYPDFCQFAYDLYNKMSLAENLEAFLEIRTVNDKSVESFKEFAGEWSNKAGIGLDLDLKSAIRNPQKLEKFIVAEKTWAEIGGAFLVRLEPKKKKQFESGDLLNVYPANDHRERQYSIGKIGGQIQLSVKRHEFGLGSNFLYGLEIGQVISGRIVANPEFHFNPKSPKSILISNGTGIAPFLGMIDQNSPVSECHLYCGFRNSDSFEPYKDFLESKIKSGKLTSLNVAYSREADNIYVKDLLKRDSELIASALLANGQILICGSLAMQNNVLELLSEICESIGKSLSHFQSSGQIKMDCY